MSVNDENRLKDQVSHIVNTIQNGYLDDETGEMISGFDYLTDVLDIEYIVDSKKQYLGARILVAFGGPNIWINTRTQQVEGYWWNSRSIQSYNNDEMDIDGALSELYYC
jgi:hypothetical protein